MASAGRASPSTARGGQRAVLCGAHRPGPVRRRRPARRRRARGRSGRDRAAAGNGVRRRAACAVGRRRRGRARRSAAGRARARARARACRVVVEAPLPADAPAGRLVDTHDLDAPAAIIHTSGTTAAPKPVDLTFANWLWSALGSAVALGLDPDERWLCPLPLSHVGGLSIARAQRDLRHDGARAESASTSSGALRALRDGHARLARADDAGAAARRRPGAAAGAAQRCCSAARRSRRRCSHRAARAGVPGHHHLRHDRGVLADRHRRHAAVLHARGARARRRDRRPGPTIAPGVGGALHTGDLGELDDAGRLRITGRKADTIVTGGENVAPTEVEAVLADHPAVAEAAVHGAARPPVGRGGRGHRGAARAGQRRPTSCARSPAGRLAPYKVPKAITFVDALPRTASGKLQRRDLG